MTEEKETNDLIEIASLLILIIITLIFLTLVLITIMVFFYCLLKEKMFQRYIKKKEKCENLREALKGLN